MTLKSVKAVQPEPTTFVAIFSQSLLCAQTQTLLFHDKYLRKNYLCSQELSLQSRGKSLVRRYLTE